MKVRDNAHAARKVTQEADRYGNKSSCGEYFKKCKILLEWCSFPGAAEEQCHELMPLQRTESIAAEDGG